MGKKKKIVLALLFLVLFVGPIALALLNTGGPVAMVDGPDDPIKRFLGAADPTVDTAAQVTNLDDSDNLYCGGYKDYIMTVDLDDADGSEDIANVTIIFKGTTEFASFQWINTSNTWAELTGASYLRLTTGTNTTHATEMNITITFKLEWACPDLDDVDIVTQVYATDGTEVNDTANVNYDFDSDLTLASSTFFTYAKVEQNSPMALNTLTYSYEDSGGDNYPLAAETDFWVSRAAVTAENVEAGYFESASYSDSTGIANFGDIRASATGAGHDETWTLYAVTQSGGSGGTDLMGTTQTDTVEVTDSSPGPQEPEPTGPIPTIPSFLFSYEGMLVAVVMLVVMGIVGYVYYSGASAPKRRRKRSTRRKSRKSKRK